MYISWYSPFKNYYAASLTTRPKLKQKDSKYSQGYYQNRPGSVNNATLSIFTSSGRRELVERWELFQK